MKKAKIFKAAAALCACSLLSVSVAACTPHSPHSHEFGNWTTVKEATCTENGLKKRECACGKQEEQIITAAGHKSGEWLHTEASHYKLCSVCGESFAEETHSFNNGVCGVCGYEEKKQATLSFALTADGTGYAVTGAEGDMVIIPQTHENLPVTEIAEQAFKSSEIVSVVISSSVKKIGKQAFSKCMQLKKIEIPATVEETGEYICWASGVEEAVIDCNLGSGAFYQCKNLVNVTFGSGVTELSDYQFQQCSALTEVEIPESVTSCGVTVFSKSGLQRVVVSGDLTGGVPLDTKSIFQNCTDLVEARFTATAAKYSYYAFDTCQSLERYVLEEDYPHYKSVEGIIYSNDMTVCVKAPHGIAGNIVIPEGVTKLSGEQPFRDCKNLTGITLPSTLTKIENACFYGSGVTSINIPDGVTEIGAAIFSGCGELKTVHIGAGVKSIGRRAFADCPLLESVTVSSKNETFKSVDGCVVSRYGTDNCTLVLPDAFNRIPACVKRIGEYAFSGRSLISVNIPAGITVIERGAFDGCTELANVTLPSGLSTIESYAFKGCTALQSLTVPSSVTYISCWAFQNCTALSSVTFENKNGWTATKNNSPSSSAVSLNLSSPTDNATYLTETYYDCHWRRQA